MSFAHPLALLALLAVPAIVALHLFRRRLQQRRVAAVFLFTGERLVTAAGRTRTRLLRSPSLWLECLAAALLALWLAGPSWGGIAARHVVFVLDDSASMAVQDAEPARRALRARIDDLASRDRVTLLRTGPRGEILVGPRALPSEIEPALARWQPAQPRHDPLPALDLARELATAADEVVFVTDELAGVAALGRGALDIHVVAVGEAVPNAAILSAQRFRREAGGEELRVRVGRYGAISSVEIKVLLEENELLHRTLDLAPGHADLVLPLPAGAGPVEVRLGDDALAIDNVAWVAPEPLRTVRVCDLLEPEEREALGLDRVFGALDGHVLEAELLNAQLVLATSPGRPIAGQTEVVLSAGDGERDGWRGPFVVDRGHPWLTGVHLHGVVWLAGRETPPGRVVVAVGNRALMTEEFVRAGRRLRVNVDPSAGNLVRSPDWPLLFANLLDVARDEVPGLVAANVTLGDEIRFRRTLIAESADSVLWLADPLDARERGRGDRVVGWVPQMPGLHRVFDQRGYLRGVAAVRFHDPAESDLGRLTTKTMRPDAAALSDDTVRDTSIERRLLAVLLLAAALLDWWVLGRRRA